MHLPQIDEKEQCGGRKLRTDREECGKVIQMWQSEQTKKLCVCGEGGRGRID